jgi:hypothetical protein
MKFTSIILTLCLATNAFGQCSNGKCSAPVTGVKYLWLRHDGDPTRWYLYAGAQLLGGFDTEDNYFRPYHAAGDSWGPRQPSSLGVRQDLFGVDTSKLTGKDTYKVHNGNGCNEVSRQEAHKIVGEKLQDDSSKLRITVIGDDGQQKKAIADIQSLMKDVNDWAIVRGYPPGHWALQPGFFQSGSPTIYCQAPSGKVLHRQDDYQGGGDEAVEALRKAKNNYDVKKDPDLRKSGIPSADNSKLASYGIAAVAGAGIMYFSKRRKQ